MQLADELSRLGNSYTRTFPFTIVKFGVVDLPAMHLVMASYAWATSLSPWEFDIPKQLSPEVPAVQYGSGLKPCWYHTMILTPALKPMTWSFTIYSAFSSWPWPRIGVPDSLSVQPVGVESKTGAPASVKMICMFLLAYGEAAIYPFTCESIWSSQVSGVGKLFHAYGWMASLIDALAIHPYAWNNFPTPETWEDQMLSQVKGYIAASPYANKNMQIIFTEAGAPVCDSIPTGCTLSESGTPIRGQGQEENAEYMVKLHVIGFKAGVKIIVWYQQGFSPDPYCTAGTSGERCFGMSNSQGLRLVAHAYEAMTKCMAGKSTTPMFKIVNGKVRVYEFPSLDGSSASCIVTWSYQKGVTEVVQPQNPVVSIPLSSITSKTVMSVQNTTGASIAFTAGASLGLSPAPVFMQAQ